jgi:hypothetical protein
VGTSKTRGLKGSHNKPKGCGAYWAYAPGPDDEEEEEASGTAGFCYIFLFYNFGI